MKLPKRLDITRSCFYELPDSILEADLTPYEIMFRSRYPGLFHSRIGRVYFLQFPDEARRNLFLSELETNARREGLQVERATIYTS